MLRQTVSDSYTCVTFISGKGTKHTAHFILLSFACLSIEVKENPLSGPPSCNMRTDAQTYVAKLIDLFLQLVLT